MEAEEFPLKDEESPLKDEELVLDLTFADMDMLLSGLDFAFPLIEDVHRILTTILISSSRWWLSTQPHCYHHPNVR
jgi:hypothetical protein